MVIKLSHEQIAQLTQRESDDYIRRLHQIIVRHSPGLKADEGLLLRLREADDVVSEHGFQNGQIKNAFLIMNACEPDFYKGEAMTCWLLEGTESAEDEFMKYQQIRENLLKRMSGEPQ